MTTVNKNTFQESIDNVTVELRTELEQVELELNQLDSYIKIIQALWKRKHELEGKLDMTDNYINNFNNYTINR